MEFTIYNINPGWRAACILPAEMGITLKQASLGDIVLLVSRWKEISQIGMP